MARSVSTVSASSFGSSTLPLCARRASSRISCNPPNEGLKPAPSSFGHFGRQCLPVMNFAAVDARCDVCGRIFPNEQARVPRPVLRTLSKSRSSSVCVSM